MSAVTIAVNLVGNDGTGAAFTSFTGNVLRLTGSLGYLARMFDELGPKTIGAGLIAGTAALAFKGFFSVVETGIGAAADFEYSMVSLENALQSNADMAPVLGDAVQDMAIKTVFSITDATDAFTQLVQMGFSAQEVLYGFGPATSVLMDGVYHATEATQGMGQAALDLAQAMRTDAVQGAELLGAAMNTFENQGLSVTETANLLAGAFLNGIPSASGLSQAIASSGSAAATAGIPMKDYLITLDLLAQRGVSASTAAASLRYYIQALTDPTHKQRKELEALNLVTLGGADGWQILSSKLFDAQGNFIGLAGSVQLLQQALDGKTTKEKLEIIGELFNVRSGVAAKILTNIEDFTGQYQELSDRFDKVDIGKMAEKQLHTLLGAWDAFKDTFLSTLISIFSPIEKQLAEPILKLNDLIGWLGKLPEATRAGFAEFFIVGAVASGILAIVGAVATVIGILGVLGVTFGMIATPVGIAAGAIVGVVLAFFGLKAIWENFIQPHLKEIGDLFQRLGDFAKQAGDNLSDFFAGPLAILGGAFGVVTTGIQIFLPWLQKVVDYFNEHVKPTFDELGKKISEDFIPAWNHLKEAFQSLYDALLPVMPQLKQLGQFLGVVLLGILGLILSALVGFIAGLANMLAGVVEFFAGIVLMITGLWTVILTVISTITGVIEAVLSGHTDQAWGILSRGWEKIKLGLQDIWNGLLLALKGVWDMTLGAIIESVRAWFSAVVGWFKALYDILVGHSIVPDMMRAIASWFARLPGMIAGSLAAFVATGVSHAQQFASGFISTVSRIPGQMAGVAGSIVSAAASGLARLASIGANAGAGLMRNLIDAIRAKLGELMGLIGKIAGGIAGLLHHSVPDEGPLKDDDKWGAEFIDNLVTGMHSRMDTLRSAANLAAASMSNPFVTPRSASTAQVGTQSGTVVIPITLDGKQIAEYTLDLTSKKLTQSGISRFTR